ncbi:LexA family transcriptional regulator [Peptostreptococcus equinus]|uniref:Helix-turn-helix domain-containing protein n=1 Tax=Peptostreptococcus equinus TaxID=3003601 RepID=A0ABY7JNF7_9FIRM|nr:XRE family transcriptional regulator [Peptostreptococcus sp. CBA3647]WAW13996.1 helix-turn-helix domain-containing protein [Peptostreptococcus sp. CBA3647]
MDKIEFKERLKYVLKKSKISQNELSRLTQINKGSLSSYISGKYLPKQDKIYIIAKALNINPLWLMCESDNIDIDKNNIHPNEENSSLYSFFDIGISAGIPDIIEGQQDNNKIELSDLLLGKYSGHKDIILMRVNGDSMNKVIPHNSFIAVSTNVSINSISNEEIVVFSDEYNYSVKRFINDKKNRRYIFRPDSYDTCFEDIIYYYDNCQNLSLIGKVIMYSVSL